MLVEAYTVIAILCDRQHCRERTVWHGKDRTQCMAEAVQVRVSPPWPWHETKMSACLVDRERPGYEWAPQGYWKRKTE
jgi:hypothetical protein